MRSNAHLWKTLTFYLTTAVNFTHFPFHILKLKNVYLTSFQTCKTLFSKLQDVLRLNAAMVDTHSFVRMYNRH